MQFADETRPMFIHCLAADGEGGRDLVVGPALTDEDQDFAFTRRKRCERIGTSWFGAERQFQHHLGYYRVQVGFVAMDGTNRLHNFVAACFFENVALRSGSKHGQYVVRILMLAQDHDLAGGKIALESLNYLETA